MICPSRSLKAPLPAQHWTSLHGDSSSVSRLSSSCVTADSALGGGFLGHPAAPSPPPPPVEGGVTPPPQQPSLIVQTPPLQAPPCWPPGPLHSFAVFRYSLMAHKLLLLEETLNRHHRREGAREKKPRAHSGGLRVELGHAKQSHN